MIAQERYDACCADTTGWAWTIHEHLPRIRALAAECESAYELGVHAIVSTWALLASGLRSLTSVDLQHPSSLGADLGLVERAALEQGTDFRFLQCNTLEVAVEPVDLTFIDTWHVHDQLLAELRRFAPFTRKYLVLHDTETFGLVGEDGVSRGLSSAIVEFLEADHSWFLAEHHTNNNGLTVLARRQVSQKVMGVTGFVADAFPARHLDGAAFRQLGEELKDAAAGRIVAFDEGWSLRDCWAHRFLDEIPDLRASDPSPPADRYADPRDALLSNIVLLQRFEWMRLAAERNPDVDVFVWLEYSVLKQRGVTADVVRRYLDTTELVEVDAITAPGEWERSPVVDSRIHWRFAGSTWMCPRALVAPLADAVRDLVALRAPLTRTLTWDVNTLALVELLDVLPFRWYRGGHDETQFRGFGDLSS